MMSGSMTQKQIKQDKMDKLVKLPCAVCGQLLATWDGHIKCMNCRTCNKQAPCNICGASDKQLWKRFARQQREYNRCHLPHMEGTEGAEADTGSDASPRPGAEHTATKRSGAELSAMDEYSADSGPSTRKSPKRDGGGGSWDWEKLAALVGTIVDNSVSAIQKQNAVPAWPPQPMQ